MADPAGVACCVLLYSVPTFTLPTSFPLALSAPPPAPPTSTSVLLPVPLSLFHVLSRSAASLSN